MRYLAREVALPMEIDSAGIAAIDGQPPHPLIVSIAKQRGYDTHNLMSRRLCDDDFRTGTYILAVDADTRARVEMFRPASCGASPARIGRLTDYALVFPKEDLSFPHSDDELAMASVCDRVEDACLGLLRDLAT